MQVIYAQEKLNILDMTIFLAGPTPRDADTPSWRPQALKYLEELGFDGAVFVPEMRDGWTDDFEYDAQIEWELKSMHVADVILFWVPRELEKMPAFTTNVEFGYRVSEEPETVILAYPENAPKMRYLDYLARDNGIEVFHDLKWACERAIEMTEE